MIKIIGIDFDRPLTFAIALDKLLANKEDAPKSLDSLNEYMKSSSFKEIHSNQFPTKDDKKFMADVRALLNSHSNQFQSSFDSLDHSFIKNTICNQVVGFAGNRENEILLNIDQMLPRNERTFLMLIGQGHANYKTKNIAYLLKKDRNYNVITGKILYQNSKIWHNGFKKIMVVNELKDKPWKSYGGQFLKQTKSDFSFIDLKAHEALKQYFDYLIIAKDQNALSY